MKKIMIAVLGLAVLLVTVGIVGSLVSNKDFGNRMAYNNTNYSSRDIMHDTYYSSKTNSDEKMDIEVLEEYITEYIDRYDENLVISDVFIFEDSDYYYSIMEKDTGFGAMELLINPYTGDVYPEMGPNMMWNLKYGMHGGSSYGMMGGRGMMGRYNSRDYSSSDTFDSNAILKNDAQNFASKYVEDSSFIGNKISEQGHEFYGYYTFHIKDVDNTVGMLSVNGQTGEVWYHDWHGTVTEVIDGHDENDNH